MAKEKIAMTQKNSIEVGLGVLTVWKRNWLHFRYTFWVTLFWVLLEPLFYLLAIGYGIGQFISSVGGLPYSDFFMPALLCTTAMTVPFFESTYGNFTKLTWQKTYNTILYTPITVDEIFLGELLWSTTKGFMSILGVIVVSFLFGAIHSIQVLPVIFVLILLSFCFSVIGMFFTTLARNYDSFIYTTSGMIIPFSLFSGTYFPLENIPAAFRWLCYLSPLTHGVAVSRALMEIKFGYQHYLHLAFLILLTVFLFFVTRNRFKKRLIN